jgi:tetratricopeptide (TPR) repeat protein
MYPKQSSFILLFIGIIILCSLFFENCSPKPTSQFIRTDSAAFVGSNTCKSCHASEYNDWKISDHFKAMDLPNDSSVLGNFNDQRLQADGVNSKFFKKGSNYYINTEGEDGLNHDYLVKYTFGYFPLQQYLIEFPAGRMQSARLSWDSRNKKWFHQYANQKIPSHDWLHWTGNSQNWNTMCASCHSTNLQKNYNLEQDSYKTTFHEINVSCESCHGAGKSHIDYINSDYKSGNKVMGSMIKIAKGTDQVLQINNCAPCHARASSIASDAFNATVHSKEIMDHLIPEIPSTEHYYADGQANDEDYTYTSFIQSKMYARGVVCSNCHNPHSGKLILTGNAACLKCHTKNYDSPSHTFHQIGTTGAECKNCHMPGKVYMGNDTRFDHTFRVPRPDLSVQYATPNACNNCHTDKTAKWSADAIIKWYGPNRKYHFAEDLIPGSNTNNVNATKHLIKLLNDTSSPAIIQATAANYLANHQTNESLSALLKCLSNGNAQVRYRALKSLANFSSDTWINQAGILLTDPVRAVRIAAADLYNNLPNDKIPAEIFESYSKAKQELETYLTYQADFSVGNIMLGDYYLKQKNYSDAEKYYLRGLKKDAAINYARFNLSAAYNAENKNQEALAILLEAKKIDPKNDRVYFNLGLLYGELNNNQEAENSFSKAIELHSTNPRVYYNYGILLQQKHNISKAESVFLNGLTMDPNNPDLNYVLAILYVQSNQRNKAMVPISKLKTNYPNNPDYQQLFKAVGL